jgi:hypothetical protein
LTVAVGGAAPLGDLVQTAAPEDAVTVDELDVQNGDTEGGFSAEVTDHAVTLSDGTNNYGEVLLSVNADGNVSLQLVQLGSGDGAYQDVGSASFSGNGTGTAEIVEPIQVPDSSLEFTGGQLTAGYEGTGNLEITYSDQPDEQGFYPPQTITLSDFSLDVALQLALSVSNPDGGETTPYGGNLAATVELSSTVDSFSVGPQDLEDPSALAELLEGNTQTTVSITIAAYDNDGTQVGSWDYDSDYIANFFDQYSDGGSTGISSLQTLGVSALLGPTERLR